MDIIRKVKNIVENVQDGYADAKENIWKFLLVDLLGLSGLAFLGGVYSLSLAAGSAANGSYAYHWFGIGLMLASMILARLGL